MKTFKQFLEESYEFTSGDHGSKHHHAMIGGHEIRTSFDSGNKSTFVSFAVDNKYNHHEADVTSLGTRGIIPYHVAKVTSQFIKTHQPKVLKFSTYNPQEHSDGFTKAAKLLADKHGYDYDYDRTFREHVLTKKTK